MNETKIKLNTEQAIGMLFCIINNKWKRKDKRARQIASITLARQYLNKVEELINN
jgi:hypothetical protein